MVGLERADHCATFRTRPGVSAWSGRPVGLAETELRDHAGRSCRCPARSEAYAAPALQESWMIFCGVTSPCAEMQRMRIVSPLGSFFS